MPSGYNVQTNKRLEQENPVPRVVSQVGWESRRTAVHLWADSWTSEGTADSNTAGDNSECTDTPHVLKGIRSGTGLRWETKQSKKTF